MRIMLVDDEQPMLDELTYCLGKYADIEIEAAFTHPLRAVEYIKNQSTAQAPLPDAVLIDIDLPQMNGLDTALHIQALHPDIIVVFVTAYSAYALESFKVHPLDYILKPIKESKLNVTIELMRKQLHLLEANRKDNHAAVQINCFGNFRLWLPGSSQPIKWGTRRVKALFMFLVDRRGAPSTYHDLIKAVFGGIDNKKTANNLYVTVHKLRQLVKDTNPAGEFLRLNDNLALEISPGVCDYIDFMNFAAQNAVINPHNMKAAAAALQLCNGNYLENEDYLWAVQTAAMIDIEFERIALELAAVYVTSSDIGAAEQILLRLVARNPLSDEGYTTLLEVYMQNGQSQNFKLLYLKYAHMLTTEFGEKPPARYSRYYQAIIKD